MSDLLTQLGALAGASRFRRISEKLQQDGDKIYLESEIAFKASWFSVYYVLAQASSPLTVSEIADQMAFTHITVKNIIKELHQHNLVKIEPNPTDKRSKWISLSKKGLEFQTELEPVWLRFSEVLEEVFQQGHPDILNILDRIDRAIFKQPIHERARLTPKPAVRIVDYKPSLKEAFYDLAAPWLLGVLGGELEEEDKYTLKNPDKAYIAQGGFLFYALYEDTVVGVVALKRLDEHSFEFAKLFINPNYRNLGIATRLIERCISRCMENEAKELWLQTTMSMPQAHKLYYKLGFDDRPAPSQMDVLVRTEKVMVKVLR